LIVYLVLVGTFASLPVAVMLLLMMIVAMLMTGIWNWTIEKVAYRPLRGSFRLAPLITAIGMSIALSNFIQVAQGPRNKPIPQLVSTIYDVGGINISLKQIIIVAITAVLLFAFWYIVNHTPLGRAQRATEQDRKMAALLGIDVDRTVSITFVMGAALAAVAGTMYLMYYGVISFADGFTPGVKAFTAAVLGGIGSLPGAVLGGLLIGLIESLWSAYFTIAYKDVATFAILAFVLIFKPSGILGRPEVEKV
jgi:branched-chain amino acid transport system permease protein